MKKVFLASLLFAAFTAGAQADVLTTQFSGGNGQNGNMFDVVTKGGALTVTGFDLNLVNGTYTIEVYKKNGTWVGSQNDAGAWTMMGSGSVTSAGGSTFFDVTDFNLDASATSGLYITSTSPVGAGIMVYTDGSQVGQVAAENADLQILEGAGKAYAFGNTYTPRIWNGSIYYTNVPEPGSLALLGLGLVGLAQLRRRQQS